jgi:hypothetical protein
MDWLESAVEIDAGTAALIAEGMRQVASADGHIHHRELKLIASFEANIPTDADPPALLSADLVGVYIQSLVMVALADGRITDVELDVIRQLAADQEVEGDALEAEIVAVKRQFLGVFAGVSVFRDAVVRVAEELGLPGDEVDALRGIA